MSRPSSIAIVGMAGLFPGAEGPDALWDAVLHRRSASRPVPPERWAVRPEEILDPAVGKPDHLYSLHGCFLDAVPEVDLAGTPLDPAAVAALDPLHRLVLRVGLDAWRSAVTEGLDRDRMGVVLANIALPTEGASALARETIGAALEAAVLGRERRPFTPGVRALDAHPAALPAGLLCQALGLGGGSFTLDAACASSLYAIRLACEDLAAGRLDAVLAGGASRPQCLYTQVGFSQLQALSPSGRCAPFDTRADGLVVGEGAALFVLKRLADAEAAGDRILGVVRAVGLSNDVGGSLLAPEAEGQLRAMRAAYRTAGWSPADVDLVECHGTGTPKGDGVELASLAALLSGTGGDGRRDALPVIGSVKANIGHLLTAAGAAGLCKVLLALRERTLPPAANFAAATAAPALAGAPFRVLEAPEPWSDPGRPRRAAVSAFGFGGINGHLLLEEYRPGPAAPVSAHTTASAPGADTSAMEPTAPADSTDGRAANSRPLEPTDAPPRADTSAVETTPSDTAGVRVPTSEPSPATDAPPRADTSAVETSSSDARAPATTPAADGEAPLALVGLAAHFGRLDSLAAFSRAVLRGEPVRDERPAGRWRGLPGPDLRGAWIEEIEIPLGRFRIPPKELPTLLPQQALALAVAAAAIDDAGGFPAGPKPTAGCVVGLGLDLETTGFHLRWLLGDRVREWAREKGLALDDDALASWRDRLAEALGPALNSSRTLGALGGVVAGRIAREFALGGPSFALAGADTSGLRALEVAARLLRAGDVDRMVVAAVDLAGDLRQALATDVLRPFGHDGRPFDADSSGPALGEGAAALVLRRLDDALRDGDRIYAVLRGVGCAGGGATPGVRRDAGAAPRATAAALEAALRRTGADPDRVSLVLAGTGAPEADRLVADALHRVFAAPVSLSPGGPAGATIATESPATAGPSTDSEKTDTGERPPAEAGDEPPEPRVALSSAAAVVGDAGAAGSLAQVIAAALGLFHEVLPPLPGLETPVAGPWDRSPFHFPREPQAWLRDRADGARRALVAAAGLDGSALAALLEGIDRPASAHRAERARPAGDRDAALFLVHGDGDGAVQAATAALRSRAVAHASRHGSRAPVEPLAASWYRHHGPPPAGARTRSFVAATVEDLVAAIDRPGRAPAPVGGEVAFVFPGSGSHFVGMGRGLSAGFPDVFRALDEETEHLATQTMPGWFFPWRRSWAGDWEAEAAALLARHPERLMLGQVAHGVAVADAVRSLGVAPRAFIGYSLGESAALFAGRAWRDRDAMFDRTLGSPLFRTRLAGRCDAAAEAWGVAPPDWHVAVVNRPADLVRKALRGTVALLIVNAPRECVIGGRRADVEAVVAALGCEAWPLVGVPTVHCDLVEADAEAYRALHLLPATAPEGLRFYSAAWAEAYVPTTERCADSILADARHGFDFTRVIERAYADGARIFVEMGPGSSCTRMIGRILGDRPHLAVSADAPSDAVRALLVAVGKVAEAGAPVDLATLYGPEGGIAVDTSERRPVPAVTLPVGGPSLAAVPPPPAPKPAPAFTGSVTPPPMAPPTPSVRSDVPAPPAAGATPGLQGGRPAGAGIAAAPGGPNVTVPSTPGVLPPGSVAAPVRAMPLPAAGPAPRAVPPAGASAGPVAAGADLLRAALESARATGQAHDAFLRLATHGTSLQLEALALSQRLAALLGASANRAMGLAAAGAPSAAAPGGHLPPAAPVAPATPAPPPAGAPVPAAAAPAPFLDRAGCLEYAVGSIAKALGPQWAEADTFPTRVRLPAEPLMLVDRILTVEATPFGLDRGRLVTEHDVLPGAWYLDGGRAPVCISVEAGQADLFLSAYLGMDFVTRGERVYRLLDAVVTFHRDLPAPGEAIRYDIRILRFIRQGDTWLLFFEFDGTVNGEPIITMRDGCAGFFSQTQLDSGRGIVPGVQRAPDPPHARADGSPAAPFRPLVPVERCTLDDRQVEALRTGDLAAAFGAAFAGRTLPPPLRLPAEPRMRLVHRIVELDPAGGRHGLGTVTGEADVAPDDWYLTCHFSDDPVMPGTLMYECCLHTLRVLLLRLGWIGGPDGADLHFAPVVGAKSRLKCRGQVTPSTRKVAYRIDLREIGYDPEPYAIAEASMIVDGKHAVEMEGMSIRLAGGTREALEALWAGPPPSGGRPGSGRDGPLSGAPGARREADERLPASAAAPPAGSNRGGPEATDAGSGAPARRPAFDKAHILAFAEGNPSEAFGAPYRPFDRDRRLARLPRPPFSFVDRIVATDATPFVLAAGTSVRAECDLPEDAWYLAAARSPSMPYAALLEAALQPCGWLAAHGGAALLSDEDLFFRNLEGEATLHREILPGRGPVTARATLTNVSQAAGMILVAYDMELSQDGARAFSGWTRFGFFPPKALAEQVGIRNAPALAPAGPGRTVRLAATPPLAPGETAASVPGGLALPARAWSFLDEVTLLDAGGLRATRRVDPGDWFFRAHFFQDPVMPGSLGGEAVLEALKVLARERFPELLATHRFEPIAVGRTHAWTYRGQVLPTAREVILELGPPAVEDGPAPLVVADAVLSVDGLPIYHLRDFALRLVPVEPR